MTEERNGTENPSYDDLAEKAKRSFVRFPLVLSLLGLIFSIFYGIGGVISLISLIMAVKRIKIRRSDSLKWAIVISAVTLAICVLYVAALIGSIALRISEMYAADETAMFSVAAFLR